MKIYGQDLRAVFGQVPWQYKIVIVVGVIFVASLLVYLPYQLLSAVTRAPQPAPLQILSQASAGMLDPSLAYDPVRRRVLMAYVAEELDATFRVRLAQASGQDCQRWLGMEGGFEARRDEILAPDSQTVFRTGSWRIETPALVYDPDDHGREWKLYAYKYFWPENPDHKLKIAQHYGMIVYKYATDPDKGWSSEQWLFSPGVDYPPAPYDQMVLLKLNDLHPSLKDIVAYSRPSVVYKDGALVMTLSAFTGAATPDRIIMVISRDHGRSWAYAGTPLRAGESQGYPVLAGATLVEQAGKVYLAAVLGDSVRSGQGTFIFGFDDLFRGRLQREAKTDAPVLLKQIPLHSAAPGPRGGGFAAYSEACPDGLLTGEQSATAPRFQIFRTYQRPADK